LFLQQRPVSRPPGTAFYGPETVGPITAFVMFCPRSTL
jgi:hypothetical protein